MRQLFKIAIRNLKRNKGINAINIIGLSVGIAAILLISQYIRFENSYDSFHKNSDRIYRLVFHRHYTTGLDKSVGNNYVVGNIAKENIPEIDRVVRCKKSTEFVKVGDEIFKEQRVFFADSSFFDVFSHPVVSGNQSSFLKEPFTAVISESTARKYFGEENPVGKTILRINPGQIPIVISGVVKDVPQNSHLKFDLVVSLSSLINKSYCYTCNNTNTYFLLHEGADPEAISAKIDDLAIDYLASRGVNLDFKIEYHLQNIRDIHLHSHNRFEHEANGNYIYQIALLIVALFILLSAWLNYSNIYKAQLKKRIRAFGIRKINGASWRYFAGAFSIEVFITSLISLCLAVLFLSALFPYLKNFLQLNFSFAYILNAQTILVTVLGIAALSLLVGFLISMRLLKTKPLLVIKNDETGRGIFRRRNLVLVTQFSIAVFLIASTLVAVKQINYMQESAISMNIDQVLTVKRPVARKFNTKQREFEESLKRIPGIQETTYSTITPGEKNGWVKGGISMKGSGQTSDQFFQSNVAPGFFDFFDIKLLAGRSFLPHETNWNGGTRHIILNKQAAQALGESNYDNLLGRILVDNDDKNELGEIVGVVDGYFQNSLDQEVQPTIFNPDQFGYFLFIKFQANNPGELASQVKALFQESFKDSYFEYFFLDDYFNKQYQSHIQFNRCFIMFSIMAIIISVLSLLGTVIMRLFERVKEIGIRKVNGAKTREILTLLNQDFMKGVFLSVLIATPISYYAMSKWLENFAYKTTLDWWIFAIAGSLALGIALLAVSWQSWKAATRNPVEALRYE